MESRLAAIWSGVLGLDCVGADDRFLDLGGHSLLAAQIATRVSEAFGVTLRPDDLLAGDTVAAMAVVVVGRCAEGLGSEGVAAVMGEREGGTS